MTGDARTADAARRGTHTEPEGADERRTTGDTRTAHEHRSTRSLRVICRPSTCDGFALAGVHALPATDGTEAAAVLRELANAPGPGVIFVEESLYRALPDALRVGFERRAVPVVIPFPGPRAGRVPSAEHELVEMLRLAIGHRVRLR